MSYCGPLGPTGTTTSKGTAAREAELTHHLKGELRLCMQKIGRLDKEGNQYYDVDKWVIIQTIDRLEEYENLLAQLADKLIADIRLNGREIADFPEGGL